MTTILKKLTVILLPALVLQIIIGIYLDRPELIKNLPIGKKLDQSVLYLGDSTLKTFHNLDGDKSSIPEMLGKMVNKNVVGMSSGGYHLEMYNLIVKYVVDNNIKVDTIIIPLNMRQFSAQWTGEPWSQFNCERYILNHDILWSIAYKPLSVYSDFFGDKRAQDVYYNEKVYDYNAYAGIVRDFAVGFKTPDTIKTRKKIVFHYRYKIDPSHRRIKALEELCQTSKRHHQNILFYVTPVDPNYLESTYRGTLGIINANLDYVKGVIQSNGFTVMDLLTALPSNYFAWDENLYPNEHLKESGRRYVASRLALALRPPNLPDDPTIEN